MAPARAGQVARGATRSEAQPSVERVAQAALGRDPQGPVFPTRINYLELMPGCFFDNCHPRLRGGLFTEVGI